MSRAKVLLWFTTRMEIQVIERNGEIPANKEDAALTATPTNGRDGREEKKTENKPSQAVCQTGEQLSSLLPAFRLSEDREMHGNKKESVMEAKRRPPGGGDKGQEKICGWHNCIR